MRRRPENAIAVGLAFACGATASRAASLLDTTFDFGGSGPNNYVEHVVEQPDGKVLACGLFSRWNGELCWYMTRLNNDGSRDTSFHPDSNYWVRHMSIQPDGKIIVGGMFTTFGGLSRRLIARLNPDGSVDPSFDPGRGGEVSIGTGINNDPTPFVIWTELLPDGKVLAVGNFGTYDGAPSRGIVRINPDGSRDASFNVGGGFDTWTRVVYPMENGDLYVGGWFNSYNGRNFNRLVRLNSTGAAYTNFNPFFGDKTAVYAIAPQADGKLIVSGHSVNEQGLFNREIERLNADGSVDPGWTGKTNEKTECLLQQSDGKLIAAGYFYMVNGVPKPAIARFNADGTLDASFHAEIDGFAWTVAPARDQKLLISGGFLNVDGVSRPYLARLNLPERLTSTPPAPRIENPRVVGSQFQCSIDYASGDYLYTLQFKGDARSETWTNVITVRGGGQPLTLTDATPEGTRFYRIEVR